VAVQELGDTRKRRRITAEKGMYRVRDVANRKYVCYIPFFILTVTFTALALLDDTLSIPCETGMAIK
jgi:hypothetical protein